MKKDRPSFDEWYKTVPLDRNDMSNYNLRRAYELAPFEQLEKWRTATPEQLKDENYHLMSAYEDPKTGIWEFMKSKNHPTLKGEMDFYYGDSPESMDFRNRYSLDTSGDYYRYVPRINFNAPSLKEKEEIPVKNKFANPGLTSQQGRNMTFSAEDLNRGYMAVVPQQQTQQVNPLSAHEGVGHGSEVKQKPTVNDTVITPSVQTVATTERPRPQITSMDELAQAMGYTSPEEEARLRKASVSKQRMLAVADALRHIGNIANTVHYAPAQKFNQPWRETGENYRQGKALRDAANYKYMSYQQAKAKQEADERKLDAQIKKQEADAARNDRIADARISRYNAQNSKDAASQAYWETRARLQEEGWPLDRAIKEARKAQIDAQTEATKTRSANDSARTAAYVSKQGGSGGGGGSRGKGGGNGTSDRYFIDKDGVKHTYKNNTDLEAKLREYAPEISTTEEYVKGKDEFGKDVKGTRKVSAGTRAGAANKAYRSRYGKGRTGGGTSFKNFSIHKK